MESTATLPVFIWMELPLLPVSQAIPVGCCVSWFCRGVNGNPA